MSRNYCHIAGCAAALGWVMAHLAGAQTTTLTDLVTGADRVGPGTLAIGWLDPAAGGAGGALRFTVSHGDELVGLRIESGDGLARAVDADPSGTTTVRVRTSDDNSPNPAAASVLYRVVRVGEAGPSAPELFTVTWRAPVCSLSLAGAGNPATGEPATATAVVRHARLLGGTYGTFGRRDGPPLATLNTPRVADGALVFDAVYTWAVTAPEDTGVYELSVSGPGPFNGGTCALLLAVDGPGDVALAAGPVAEDAAPGTPVGTLSTVAPAGAGPFVYTLEVGEGDADNELFRIAGDQLLTDAPLDFEAGETRQVRVRTTGPNGGQAERAFTVNVTNVNEAPTNIRLSANALPDGTLPQTQVGLLLAEDPDVAQSFSVSLAAGAGDSGNSLFQLQNRFLFTAERLSAADGLFRTVRVQVRDGEGLRFSKPLRVRVWPDALVRTGPWYSRAAAAPDGADQSVLATAQGNATLGLAHSVASGRWVAQPFTVGSAEGWTLDAAVLLAWQDGSALDSPITGYRVRVYDDDPREAGTQTVFDTGETPVPPRATAWGGLYRERDTDVPAGGTQSRPVMRSEVALDALRLDPGTYWLAWQAAGTADAPLWQPPLDTGDTPFGGTALVYDAEGGWQPAVDAGTGAALGLPFALLGNGGAPCLSGPVHTADSDGFTGRITLSELLRVVQFFNAGGLGCAPGTEDGYAPDSMSRDCCPHASDYAPVNWSLSLTELLRLVQFFNSGGYTYCPDAGTEDVYCVGDAA